MDRAQARASFEAGLAEAAGWLAEDFAAQGHSIPSYQLVETQALSAGDLRDDLPAEGVQAVAMLSFRGAIAMDPLAFDHVLATYLVFDTSERAAAFYEGFAPSMASSAQIAVEELSVYGDGIPKSPMQCIGERGNRAALTCLVLEEEIGIVNLILFANGPAIEVEYGRPTIDLGGGLVHESSTERWFLKGFTDDAFFGAVTTVGQVLHRYANQTIVY